MVIPPLSKTIKAIEDQIKMIKLGDCWDNEECHEYYDLQSLEEQLSLAKEISKKLHDVLFNAGKVEGINQFGKWWINLEGLTNRLQENEK